MEQLPDSFVFMKVGLHANESLDQILERKLKEYDKTGMIFWGYGGSACHPTKQVQPFVRSRLKQTKSGVYLVMQSVHSTANPKLLPATQYSEDNINWKPIPKGIVVTGSKHALVLEKIEPCDLDFLPSSFSVAIGPNEGKSADEYLTGQNDKGCLITNSKPGFQNIASGAPKKIAFIAKLKDPYAVFVRGGENEK